MTSLAMDGGKSISRAKLIGVCLMLEGFALMLECIDTQFGVLNHAFYAKLLRVVTGRH